MENNILSIPKLYTKKEAAAKLRMSIQFIDDMRGLGKLPYVKLGRYIFIKDEDIAKFLEEMTVKAGE